MNGKLFQLYVGRSMGGGRYKDDQDKNLGRKRLGEQISTRSLNSIIG